MSGDAHGGGHGGGAGDAIVKWVAIFLLAIFAFNFLMATLQRWGRGESITGNGSSFVGIVDGGGAPTRGDGGRTGVTMQHPFPKGTDQYRCRPDGNGGFVPETPGTGWCHN